MIYGPKNVARGTKVFDVETKEEIRRVVSIDTETGEVEYFAHPFEITASGEVLSSKARFSAIHPIRGDAVLPCLFHCYGRQT